MCLGLLAAPRSRVLSSGRSTFPETCQTFYCSVDFSPTCNFYCLSGHKKRKRRKWPQVIIMKYLTRFLRSTKNFSSKIYRPLSKFTTKIPPKYEDKFRKLKAFLIYFFLTKDKIIFCCTFKIFKNFLRTNCALRSQFSGKHSGWKTTQPKILRFRNTLR